MMAHDLRGAVMTSAFRHLLGPALACGALFAAAPAFAQFQPCNRADLQAAADSYVTAQTTGDTTPMKFTLWVDYMENLDEATMSTGVISKPQKIDFHRTLIDSRNCSTFTEVIITDPAHPYVLGALVQSRGDQIGGMDVLVTDAKNGWLFNPANTKKYSEAENWSPIPAAERDSRQVIQAAADAYLDLFNNKNAKVPWGTPCARLEGGAYTSKAQPGSLNPDDSCNVGVPSGVPIVDRTYVIDPELGAVSVLSHFGKDQEPDFHTFRVEHGKLKYVHTITACTKVPNCGFKPETPAPAPAQASR